MYIENINIENFRCISNTEFNLSKDLNILYGLNGSGKTSILEAIHIISTGRSFLTSKIDSAISLQKDSFTIACKFFRKNQNNQIGIRKNKTGYDIKVNQAPLFKLSALARNICLLNFHSTSIFLIEGEPQFRRRYIDWWLFHTDLNFIEEWSRYHRLLKQRNAALRSDISSLKMWNYSLAESGEKINQSRKSAIDLLTNEIYSIFSEYDFSSKIVLKYHSGWSKEDSLLTAIERAQQRDIQHGFTSVGIHRSDIQISKHGKDVKELFSRGQKKFLSLLMLISIASAYKKFFNEVPIFMLDDLAAELDQEFRHEIINKIISFGGQVILTTLNKTDFHPDLSVDSNKFLLRDGKVVVL